MSDFIFSFLIGLAGDAAMHIPPPKTPEPIVAPAPAASAPAPELKEAKK